MPVSLPVVAVEMIALATVAGEAEGLFCKYSAATPATCGVAIDVPLMVFVAVSDVYHEDSIEEPGAKMSTHVPMFEKSDFASVEVVEPTVSAAATRPGDSVQASTP